MGANGTAHGARASTVGTIQSTPVIKQMGLR